VPLRTVWSKDFLEGRGEGDRLFRLVPRLGVGARFSNGTCRTSSRIRRQRVDGPWAELVADLGPETRGYNGLVCGKDGEVVRPEAMYEFASGAASA